MITFFRELWQLIKMLFKSKPSEKIGKPLEIIVMKYFPLPGFGLMMWCGSIITRAERKDAVERLLHTKRGIEKQTHEYGHCVEAEARKGDNWLSFYIDYGWQWLCANPLWNGNDAAYYTINYEIEAYANQDNIEYWKNYNPKLLKEKYTLKHRVKIYDEHRENWKEWIKTL